MIKWSRMAPATQIIFLCSESVFIVTVIECPSFWEVPYLVLLQRYNLSFCMPLNAPTTPTRQCYKAQLCGWTGRSRSNSLSVYTMHQRLTCENWLVAFHNWHGVQGCIVSCSIQLISIARSRAHLNTCAVTLSRTVTVRNCLNIDECSLTEPYHMSVNNPITCCSKIRQGSISGQPKLLLFVDNDVLCYNLLFTRRRPR